ncbi:MAG: LLM class flavin-dependent oxidoreductase [Candidatus Binatia bacterium]
MSLKFGVTLPTFVWPGLDYKKTVTIVRDFAGRAEELGFASITVWDHLTDAPGLYGGSWLDPLLCLSHAAACTRDIKLGTHILVVPLRHPVLLAKEIATLDYVSGGRFFFGVGPGWSQPEFDAMGIDIRERGRRTDEILDAVKLLLTQKNVSFEGEFYQIRNVTIDPRPTRFPEIWVAGGSRIPDPLSPDKPYMVKTVLKRIAKHADVFTCRASGNREFVKRDFQTVRDHLKSVGRDPSTLGLAQVQAIYAVDTDDHEEALNIQRPHFETMMGTHRTWEHVQECYMVGTIKEIVARLKDLESSGLQHVTLQPTAPEMAQLELWADKILPHFR